MIGPERDFLLGDSSAGAENGQVETLDEKEALESRDWLYDKNRGRAKRRNTRWPMGEEEGYQSDEE